MKACRLNKHELKLFFSLPLRFYLFISLAISPSRPPLSNVKKVWEQHLSCVHANVDKKAVFSFLRFVPLRRNSNNVYGENRNPDLHVADSRLVLRVISPSLNQVPTAGMMNQETVKERRRQEKMQELRQSVWTFFSGSHTLFRNNE